MKKLTELESQMKTFHDNMARRLGSPVLATLREDAELASSAVAELLAPYREECGKFDFFLFLRFVGVETIFYFDELFLIFVLTNFPTI